MLFFLFQDEPDELEDNLKVLLEKLQINYTTSYIETENEVMAFTDIDTSPAFSFAAKDKTKEEAQLKTLQQLYEHLQIMSK